MKITFLASGNIKSNFSYRILALARSLHTLGHNVTIIAPCADKYNKFIPEYITEIDGVHIFQPFQFNTKRPEINLLPYIFGTIKFLLKSQSDLVYIYKPTPISVIGLVRKLFFKTQTIVDFDDLGSEVMRIEGHPVYQRKLVEYSERMSAYFADRIVTTSNFLYAKYSREYTKKPILIIPNGVENDWFETISETKKISHRIVFLGSLNRQNILEPLFDVLPNIVSLHLDLQVEIIGDGKYLQYFKDKAENLNISKYITFTGWLSIEQVKTRLHFGDIGYCYMPDDLTIRAASNMKVPQYMAHGVVTLVSNVGDLEKTVDFGSAGYVCPPNDLESLQKTLLTALADPKRNEKALRAQLISRETLSWDYLANTFIVWLSPTSNTTGKTKIYIVETSVPGDYGGGEIRNFNLLKQLSKQSSFEIELFCISSKQTEKAKEEIESKVEVTAHVVPNSSSTALKSLFGVMVKRILPTMYNFKKSGLGDVFRKRCEESMPHIVHIEQPNAYYCIRPHIAWLKKNNVKIIFDSHNVEYKLLKESINILPWYQKISGAYILSHLKKLEIEASSVADTVLACSIEDATFFKTHNTHTYVISNGVNSKEFEPLTNHQNPTLIFTGNINYPPNADAVKYYLTDIHPIIKKAIPHIEVIIIGAEKSWLQNLGLGDDTIVPHGFVDDVRPYLYRSSIGICPVRYGSGTRIKILTYMAAGLPVVSTSKGAEGVAYENGRDIIISNDAREFADNIIHLLQNTEFRQKIAQQGHEFIKKNFDWDEIGKKLLPLYTHG